MYQKLDEQDKKIIEKAEELTFTDYEIKGDYISVDKYISIIEDLIIEAERLKEENEDYDNDIRNNYRPIQEDYGISDRNFI